MDTSRWRGPSPVLPVVLLVFLGLTPQAAQAHCDAMNGPVVKAADEAMRTGDFSTIAIWVGDEQSAELRETFQEARAVHTQGGDAARLAERYFFQNAVRLHREAEGMCYTGLRPAQPMPEDIAAAERALETGEVAPVVSLLAEEIRQQTTRLYERVKHTEARKDESTAAGRDWVDAYVKYITYVHGLDQTIKAGPEHGVGEE